MRTSIWPFVSWREVPTPGAAPAFTAAASATNSGGPPPISTMSPRINHLPSLVALSGKVMTTRSARSAPAAGRAKISRLSRIGVTARQNGAFSSTYLRRLLAVCSISSEAWIALEFVSYARCETIIFTISSTTCTLDISKKFWLKVPKPSKPGMPTMGGLPLAAVAVYKFWPMLFNPALFTKRISSNVPFRLDRSGRQW